MTMSAYSLGRHRAARLPARLLALAQVLAFLPLPALASATGTCGPIGGEYVLKNRFTADNILRVARQGKDFRFSLHLLHATTFNDGSLTSNGSSEGSFSVKNCRASFDDPENACRLKFVFKGKDTVSILQEGACQFFGANINATGDFRKQ